MVIAALRDRWGVEPLLLDPATYPSDLVLALEYERDGAFKGGWAGAGAHAPGITALWQGVHVGAGLPAMEPGVRETCVAASEMAVVGFLESLRAFQLDPYWNKLRADNKPHQLRVAQRLGLEIPETLISNDAAAVRAFARRCPALITKVLAQPKSVGPASAGEQEVVFATAMTAAELEDLDGLELCPMIFQERIENRLDVRVTVVGQRLFAAAVDTAARAGDEAEVDWRRQSYARDRVPVWAPYELPVEIADRLHGLLDYFGLNYGAADFIVRPDGRHVFLELNASGSFAFLGAEHAAAIAAAVADVLADPSARRVAGHV